jgi:large subunit ribosomal protein L17
MHHRRKTTKLGRSSAHRAALLASLVCGLIEQKRIRTTLAKARLARSEAEKLVTVARAGLSNPVVARKFVARQRVLSALRHRIPMQILFKDIVPKLSGRNGGYTRIVKLDRRRGDNAEMALLEWVGLGAPDVSNAVVSADAAKKS